MRFPQRRLILWLWPAFAQVLLRSFQPVFLTPRRTKAPRSWPSRLVSTPTSRCQNTHGLCLVGGIITLDDAFFTTEIVVYSGANALTPFGCVAFLDTASPQTFIRRDGLDSMLSVGAHPPRANGHALLDPGVVFANLALCKFRQASA